MTIKFRLILLALLVVAGMAGQSALTWYSTATMARLQENRVLAEQLNSDMLRLRRHEKDFLARLALKYAEAFDTDARTMGERIDRLSTSMTESGMDTTELKRFESIIAGYREVFEALVSLQRRIGLTPEDGLYGSLRSAVHAVEDRLKAVENDRLLRRMLMLRRHEKDFMLRHNPKYVGKLDTELAAMREDITRAPFGTEEQQALLGLLDQYATDFHQLVSGEQEKGLDSENGLQGRMRTTVHQTETALAALNERLKEQLDASSQQLHTLTVALSLIIIAIVVALVAMLAHAILNPVHRLMAVMDRVRAEEDLTLRAEVSGRDEIASMADNFNRLLTDFQQIIREVFGSTDQLSTASEELSSITEQTNQAMAEQLRETDQVAAAIEEMSATVQEVARNTTDTAGATEEAESSASRGKEVVDTTTRSISTLANEVKQAGEVIARLESDADAIGKVLDVINGIAEQTNLLALNAAIEAARAGEQGRGFAVVADEVRTLAQRTQDATGEIEDMIGRLQGGAREAVSAMNAGRSRADEAVSSAEEADAALDVIHGVVANIHRMTQQIATAAEQQGSVAADLARNITVIKENADTTGDSVHHIAAASEDLSALAQRLHEHVRRFTV